MDYFMRNTVHSRH